MQLVTPSPLSHDDAPKHVKVVFKQRKGYVKKGDPRPTMYCTWCGPRLPKDQELEEETVCKACMILYDNGWRYVRELYVSCGKAMQVNKFTNSKGKI